MFPIDLIAALPSRTLIHFGCGGLVWHLCQLKHVGLPDDETIHLIVDALRQAGGSMGFHSGRRPGR